MAIDLQKFLREQTSGARGAYAENGFRGLVETAQQNATQTNPFNRTVAEGRMGPIAFRGGALVMAGAAIGDAVFRGRGTDGADRNVAVRGAELLAGLAVGAGALLIGRR